MIWHEPTETPKPDTEVLAEVDGWKYAKYAVLKYVYDDWWQHIPANNETLRSDGWCGIEGITIKRWAYVEEEQLSTTHE